MKNGVEIQKNFLLLKFMREIIVRDFWSFKNSTIFTCFGLLNFVN